MNDRSVTVRTVTAGCVTIDVVGRTAARPSDEAQRRFYGPVESAAAAWSRDHDGGIAHVYRGIEYRDGQPTAIARVLMTTVADRWSVHRLESESLALAKKLMAATDADRGVVAGVYRTLELTPEKERKTAPDSPRAEPPPTKPATVGPPSPHLEKDAADVLRYIADYRSLTGVQRPRPALTHEVTQTNALRDFGLIREADYSSGFIRCLSHEATDAGRAWLKKWDAAVQVANGPVSRADAPEDAGLDAPDGATPSDPLHAALLAVSEFRTTVTFGAITRGGIALTPPYVELTDFVDGTGGAVKRRWVVSIVGVDGKNRRVFPYGESNCLDKTEAKKAAVSWAAFLGVRMTEVSYYR